MRRLFIFGVVAGFAAVLAAAHYVPWVQHERVPAATSVVANGGRAETFIVRLPVDRIASLGSAAVGLGPNVSLPAEFADRAAALEHFKIRDSNGAVIGIGTRHWTETADGPAVAWGLTIPGRGAVMMASPGHNSSLLETALFERGYAAGSSWTGSFEIAAVADPATTRTVRASNEFGGLQVSFTETWSITGVDEAGEIRGTIVLETVGRRGS